jgi:5-methylcytosine-specific restriction endonuclease McrA
MKDKNSRCLVLNSDYSPLTIVGWQKAILWSIKYENSPIGVDVVDFYQHDCIKGVNKNYPIPCIVKTRKYYRINNQRVNFSRKNLFIRDGFTCQYCGIKFEIKKLTYDHVIPKSLWDYKKGSPTTWTNIVTACTSCNRKKGNKMISQCGMKLQNLPIVPNKSYKYLPIYDFLSTIRTDLPEEWKNYLPGSYY